MRRLLATIALLVVGLTGCAGQPRPAPTVDAYPAGSTVHTLEAGGVDRDYRVYVPTTLGDGPASLIVMLHGGFGSAAQAELVYGWDAQAERDGTIVAYPDGIRRSWNAGGCCGAAAAGDADDVGFVEAIVAEIARAVDIDPRRVYAAGMSNGGLLAYRLACESEVFAAIGVVSATMLVDCDAPGRVSVMHIHGARDASVPVDGSVGAGTQQIDGPPLTEVIAYWHDRDGCRGTAERETGDPQVRALDATGCVDGTAVSYIVIADAGHQWPGARSSEIREELGGDPPSKRLDATAELAAFFAAHPLAE